MKTVLRIIIILLVAAVVAGAFSLTVNNSSSTSGSGSAGQSSALTGTNSLQPLARPEGGDHDEGSGVGGLAGVLGTLLKLTGITLLVLALQKGWSQLGSLKLKPVQR